MVQQKERGMGRFSVEVELANNRDLENAASGFIQPEAVRRTMIRGVVDSGATRLVLPESVARQLGLRTQGTVGYADDRIGQRELASGVHLTYAGRSSVFNAIVEPNRESALIGAIVMEDLDLIIDCTSQRLVPRDPKQIISEIE